MSFLSEKTGRTEYWSGYGAHKVYHLQIGYRRDDPDGALLLLVAGDLSGKIDFRTDYFRSNSLKSIELQGIVNPGLLLLPLAGGGLKSIDHLGHAPDVARRVFCKNAIIVIENRSVQNDHAWSSSVSRRAIELPVRPQSRFDALHQMGIVGTRRLGRRRDRGENYQQRENSDSVVTFQRH